MWGFLHPQMVKGGPIPRWAPCTACHAHVSITNPVMWLKLCPTIEIPKVDLSARSGHRKLQRPCLGVSVQENRKTSRALFGPLHRAGDTPKSTLHLPPTPLVFKHSNLNPASHPDECACYMLGHNENYDTPGSHQSL